MTSVINALTQLVVASGLLLACAAYLVLYVAMACLVTILAIPSVLWLIAGEKIEDHRMAAMRAKLHSPVTVYIVLRLALPSGTRVESIHPTRAAAEAACNAYTPQGLACWIEERQLDPTSPQLRHMADEMDRRDYGERGVP